VGLSGWISFLNELPLAGYMFVVALGFTLGRISWRGLALGPAAGTLLIALWLGRAGLSLDEMYGGVQPPLTLGAFGFALFIYSVGFEAGPRFFASLRHREGWHFVFLGLLVNVLAIAVALGCNAIFGFGESGTPGLLAGALTSAPTYAAALEVCSDRTALAYSFALTYPFGIAGVILLIHFLPRLMRDNLAAGTRGDDDTDSAPGEGLLQLRTYNVQVEAVQGRSLRELDLTHSTGCAITRLHRGDTVRVPDADTMLEEGDHVGARGTIDQLHRFEQLVGAEIYDEDLRSKLPSARAIRVSKPGVAGQTLADLNIIGRDHCIITRVKRGDVEITPTAELRLAREDVVMVAGTRENVRNVAERIGRFERSSNETDVAVYAGGILLGVVLGQLHFGRIGLGFAGGLLISGLLLGRYRRIGRLSANVPVAARQLVRDLGILLFITEAGLGAGAAPASGLAGMTGAVIFSGMLTTLLPMLIAVLVGRRLLRMRPVDTWGSVCGGMTSSAALVTLRRAADSNEPALSYAAAFAVASVLLTLAGPLVVYLAS